MAPPTPTSPASMVRQHRYGDRHRADGQQGVGEMPEQETGAAGAGRCIHFGLVTSGVLRGMTKPSVRALISRRTAAAYCSPGLTVSRLAVSEIVDLG